MNFANYQALTNMMENFSKYLWTPAVDKCIEQLYSYGKKTFRAPKVINFCLSLKFKWISTVLNFGFLVCSVIF